MTTQNVIKTVTMLIVSLSSSNWSQIIQGLVQTVSNTYEGFTHSLFPSLPCIREMLIVLLEFFCLAKISHVHYSTHSGRSHFYVCAFLLVCSPSSWVTDLHI